MTEHQFLNQLIIPTNSMNLASANNEILDKKIEMFEVRQQCNRKNLEIRYGS